MLLARVGPARDRATANSGALGPAQVFARGGRIRESGAVKDYHPFRTSPCVHLDAGVDGNWSGHLLHLPPGTNDRILRTTSAGWAACALTVATECDWSTTNCRWWRESPLGAVARRPPHRRLLGRGRRRPRRELFPRARKAGASLRWATARLQPGRRAAADGGGDEAAEEEAAKAAKAKAKEEAAAKKKKRIVTKGGGMKMKQGASGRTG